MTLGTAASSSIRNVKKFESLGGASSARKMDEPTPKGTARKQAKKRRNTGSVNEGQATVNVSVWIPNRGGKKPKTESFEGGLGIKPKLKYDYSDDEQGGDGARQSDEDRNLIAAAEPRKKSAARTATECFRNVGGGCHEILLDKRDTLLYFAGYDFGEPRIIKRLRFILPLCHGPFQKSRAWRQLWPVP